MLQCGRQDRRSARAAEVPGTGRCDGRCPLPALVILNPYAARWKAKARLPEVEAALRAARVEYRLQISEGPGHATELARQGVGGGDSPIIAAGGDGTIGEVLNGLFSADAPRPVGPLGIMPLGTANDFVCNLGLPLDLPTAAQTIAAGHTRLVDVGSVNDWVFANNSAIGLEPVVTLINIQMVHTKGVVRYLIAALRAIWRKPEWQMDLRWDDGQYQGPVSLVSVGNCPLTGGLFRMTPAADPADGRLTFIHGYAASRLGLLRLLPKAIRGVHVDDPAVSQYHCRELRIRSQTPTPMHADGEIRVEAAQEFVYRVLPASLKVLCPPA